MNVPKPSWFRDDQILISNPSTCGINKDGLEQYKVDSVTGVRSLTDIDNELAESVTEVVKGAIKNPHTRYVDKQIVLSSKVLVPQYHDKTTIEQIKEVFKNSKEFTVLSIGELEK